MKLYSYWRSTTSYRVRIALNLKGIDYEIQPVDLLQGEQSSPDYVELNPIRGVPTLITDDGTVLTQSMAILDYLDQIAPDPPLLPQDDPINRARILAAAMVFATDVHPVNNLKVIQKLPGVSTQSQRVEWMLHWMDLGFKAYAELIAPKGIYSFGQTPTLADVCFVAQAYNADRWGLDLAPYPRLVEINENCLATPAFAAAKPDQQRESK